MSLQSPPSVTIYIRSGYFWYYYYDKRIGKPIRKTTGYPADINETKRTDWWKRSKYGEALDQLIFEIQNPNAIQKIIPRSEQTDIYSLLENRNKANEEKRDQPLSDRTLEKRKLSVKFLLRFKPDFQYRDLTEEFVKEFRAWGKTKVQAESLKGYWRELRPLFDHAVKLHYTSYNYFRDFGVKSKKKSPKQISKEDVEKVLVLTHQHKPALFGHIATELFNGLRVSEICQFRKEWVDSKNKVLIYHNTKAGRLEYHPIAVEMEYVLDVVAPGWRSWHLLPLEERPTGFLFYFRSRRNVNYYLGRACEFVQVSRITTHDLKRLYIQLLAKSNPDPRVFDLAAHHAPSVNQTAVEYYAGNDINLVRKALEPVLRDSWRPLIDKLKTMPPIEGESPYKFSNPKSHEAAKQRKLVHDKKQKIDTFKRCRF